ncbi:MAG: VCBS repeat-containing protein [Fulvivirga sp.]|nr:VCBS repeat-containing protein [Fulvivirga sp.]
MMRISSLIIGIILIATACQQSEKSDSKPLVEKASPVFEKISSQKTGITFNNKLNEDVSTRYNIFDFDYFFNGSGVGIGDLNNDGLNDIVFTGNQVDNRIYINQGEFEFLDITQESGINVGKGWANGVVLVDVNQDGWLDIYISQGGPGDDESRKNRLYINNKDLSFTEKSQEFGLDDHAISTQSAFFDLDKDGDLDCIVMNETPLHGYPPQELFKKVNNDPELLHKSSSHIYRNNGGIFEDITEEAGLLRPGFGLGLVVSDINEDNWPDIYIANDYYIPDALYINNGDGTFSEQIKNYTEQVSFYGMGVDIADINNDLRKDIFVLDMAISDHYKSKTLMASMNVERFDLLVNEYDFAYQYMYNTLQLNAGNNTFRNISHITGLSKTDWSWAALMADYDLDGFKDIYVTNGYRRYATDNDTRVAVMKAMATYNGNVPLEVKKKIYYNMPSEKLSNILFKNNGDFSFDKKAHEWGLAHPSFSNGAAYGDLDNDGDPDLVVNNIEDEAFIYRNNTLEKGDRHYLKVITKSKSGESLAKIFIYFNGQKQLIESKSVRGYRSSVDPAAFFGLGSYADKIDSVVVVWPSGKSAIKVGVEVDQILTFHEQNAEREFKIRPATNSANLFEKVALNKLGVTYKHDENEYDDFQKEILLPYKQSRFGPKITVGDINNDAQDDFIIGGASGQPLHVFIGTGSGFQQIKSDVFVRDKVNEYLESVLFYLDWDGNNDIFVVSGGNEFEPNSTNYKNRIYINDGKGYFTAIEEETLDNSMESSQAVATFDFNKDGLNDIVVGNRIVPQHYPKFAPSRLLKNIGGKLEDVTQEVIPELQHFGIVNKIVPTDFDRDGWVDLLVVGEWTAIGIFKNNQGRFENIAGKSDLNLDKGWWYTIVETDVNNDDLPDFVIGNVGRNTKYKATKEKPLKVFGHDFDENGTWDLVLSSKYKDKYVPFRGKECSTQQMPFISQKIPTYDMFAKASISDVYGQKLNEAYQAEATEFNSILLINQGDGKFIKQVLPVEAQFGAVLSGLSKDLNGDGYQDVVLGGNLYSTEPETPRFDTHIGTLLLSNGKDNYEFVANHKVNLYLTGDIRSIDILDTREESYLLVAKNNSDCELYKLKLSDMQRLFAGK